jgi:hypothetical protein
MRPHPAYILAVVAVTALLFLFLKVHDAVGYGLLFNVAVTIGWGCVSKPQSKPTRILKRIFLIAWGLTIGAWVFAVMHGSDRDHLQWPSALSAEACLLVAIIVSVSYWVALPPKRWRRTTVSDSAPATMIDHTD